LLCALFSEELVVYYRENLLEVTLSTSFNYIQKFSITKALLAKFSELKPHEPMLKLERNYKTNGGESLNSKITTFREV